MSGSAGALQLDDRDRAMLAGERGPGVALAMRVLTTIARVMGATGLIDIAGAHVDGCFYVGDVSIDFAETLRDGGARVVVPTTTNSGSVDLLHRERWRGPVEYADNAARLMAAYADMGCAPTWTCAPYVLRPRPGLSEHVAWGESNAIVFANSVLGARTQRYGDFVEISAAVTGRAPYAGLHTDEGRLGEVRVRVDVPDRWLNSEVFFSLLGHVVGRRVGGRIPVITGVPAATEDQLKALGSAAASTGSVAMFHVVGVTPEAPDLASCLPTAGPQYTVDVGVEDLRGAWQQLGSGQRGDLALVCLGTPHFSPAEFTLLEHALAGRRVHEQTPLMVSTGRRTWADLEASGAAQRLTTAGVQVVTDTCMYATPILGRVDGLVMTNSAKFAWYAPANLHTDVVLAGLTACVESAVAGRPVGDPLA